MTLLLLALALSAADPVVCAGSSDSIVTANTPVTICWGLPPPTSANKLLYFRVRQSQSQTGAYQQLARITYDPATMLLSVPDPCTPTTSVPWLKIQYTFTPKFTAHYFVTAVYEVVENGVTVTKESVGSAHVRVTLTP